MKNDTAKDEDQNKGRSGVWFAAEFAWRISQIWVRCSHFCNDFVWGFYYCQAAEQKRPYSGFHGGHSVIVQWRAFNAFVRILTKGAVCEISIRHYQGVHLSHPFTGSVGAACERFYRRVNMYTSCRADTIVRRALKREFRASNFYAGRKGSRERRNTLRYANAWLRVVGGRLICEKRERGHWYWSVKPTNGKGQHLNLYRCESIGYGVFSTRTMNPRTLRWIPVSLGGALPPSSVDKGDVRLMTYQDTRSKTKGKKGKKDDEKTTGRGLTERRTTHRRLYGLCGFLNHACAAHSNCTWSNVKAKKSTEKLLLRHTRVVQPIDKGEELTFCYWDYDPKKDDFPCQQCLSHHKRVQPPWDNDAEDKNVDKPPPRKKRRSARLAKERWSKVAFVHYKK